MGIPTRVVTSALVLGLAALSSTPASGQRAPVAGPVRVTDVATILLGQIVGSVADEAGQPLDGAVISALGGTTTFAVSDKSGQFSLGQLPPGPYLLRAHLQGFLAARSTMVNVRPASRSASSFTLRREGTAAAPRVVDAGVGATAIGAPVSAGDQTGGRDESDVAWRLRHLKRGVLRDTDTMAGLPTEDDTGFLTDSFGFLGRAVGGSAKAASALFSDLSIGGQVNLLTTGAFDSPVQLLEFDRASSVAYFSLGAPVGSHGQWAVRAAMNQNDAGSWMLAGSYVVQAQVPHRYQMGMSYSVQSYDGGNALAIASVPNTSRNAGSIFADDEWAVSRRLTLGYGATYARYDYLKDPALVSPRFTATLAPTPSIRLHVAAARRLSAPGAEEFLPSSRAEFLPPQRTFSPFSPANGFRTQETQHLEVGVERLLNGASVGLRVYRERIDDQLITVFGLRQPAAASALGHYRVGSVGDADLRGVGLTLTHAIIRHVRGSMDYSVSSANWLAAPPAEEYAVVTRWIPAATRPSHERIHDLTTSVQADVPITATRVVLLYKLNNAFIGGDGTSLQPSLGARFDLQVNQALPFMNFSASQWEMLVAVRSLFHESLASGSSYDELLVVRPPKRLVGGITVKF